MDKTIKIEPREVVLQEEIKEVISQIELISCTDNFDSVSINISIGGTPKTILLWEGEDYVKIGQYTDDDIVKRIYELI